MLNPLAEPVVDFLTEPQPAQKVEPVIDFLGELERKRNPPYMCTCEHTLMVHAEKNEETGIYTHQKGRCLMVGCICRKATPKEG